ncbi:hypothetical protein [Dielma fastidiosa]|uniref:hypothetical protein n=1 Tax=Dielma fastidiosa TaxID=1034346 RepID=UPI0035626755
MIEIKNCTVSNIENALRGMRNPLDSWEKSDSITTDGKFILGPNDLKLARKLCAAGSDHRKFLRQIFVSLDITAPLYWWKEFDTYKVGTVANSTSTMHTIHKKEINESLFSCEKLDAERLALFKNYLDQIEQLRQQYLIDKDPELWIQMIQLLPSSFNQLRTCTMNFETLLNIYHSRKNHKLSEWRQFCDTILKIEYFDMIAEISSQSL